MSNAILHEPDCQTPPIMLAVFGEEWVKRDEATKHKHKCKCGVIWEHGGHCGGNLEAHCCPACHTPNWSKYYGKEPSVATAASQD